MLKKMLRFKLKLRGIYIQELARDKADANFSFNSKLLISRASYVNLSRELNIKNCNS